MPQFILFSSWYVATIILKLNSMFVLQERPPQENLTLLYINLKIMTVAC